MILTCIRTVRVLNMFFHLRFLFQVLLNDSPVSSLKVLLTVLTPKQVEHNTKYVITKLGGNVTLDCTDFEGEDVHWKRLGGEITLKFSL